MTLYVSVKSSINPVNNAVKFTERGEVLVTLALEEQLADRVKVKFSVRDSGIGMTREQSAKLFQAFSQADTSRRRGKYGGTGLGLSISNGLVEMMEGSIWAESELPAQVALSISRPGLGLDQRDTHMRFIPDPRRHPGAGCGRQRVGARDPHRGTFQGFALRADSVSSGEDAVREIAALRFAGSLSSSALMDWHLPGMDGLQASRMYQAQSSSAAHPQNRNGYGIRAGRYQDAGRGDWHRYGYLLKPVNQSLLYDTLVDLFGFARPGGPRSCLRGKTTARYMMPGESVFCWFEDNEINQQVATEPAGERRSHRMRPRAAGGGLAYNHGGEAVKILTERDSAPAFDVVFMDLQMPEMDGITATTLLRRNSAFAESSDYCHDCACPCGRAPKALASKRA